MYVFLLHNKYETLDPFKVFKAEVGNQYGKQIQIVILIELVNIMVDTLRMDKHLVLLLRFFMNMG